MTSILKSGPYTRTTEQLLGRLPSFIPAPFHPHHGYDLSSRILRHRTMDIPQQYDSPMDMYMSFHVVMLHLSRP